MTGDGDDERRPHGARRWMALVVGAVAGVALMFLVYVPAGRPDAAEVTFALGLATIVSGLWVGWKIRTSPRQRIRVAGNALLGLGVGSLVAFALIFFTPIGAMM